MSNSQMTSLLRSALGLTVSLVISYYTMNWFMKSLDPTHKDKEKVKKKVPITIFTRSEFCLINKLFR